DVLDFLADKSGFDPTVDHDTSELAGDVVEGYAMARQMNGRTAQDQGGTNE
ncbi:MAG: hypothetical protein IH991_22275, partial [Planctomycetes bacterium]|nr:hypothetical protein [Planctomycetota bacterium]